MARTCARLGAAAQWGASGRAAAGLLRARLGLTFSLLVSWTKAQPLPRFLQHVPPNVEAQLRRMSLEEKIGQLLMVPAFSDPKSSNIQEVRRWITEYQVGGIIFMRGTPTTQITLTNTYQRLSKRPLLIAMDAEWGPAMRLDSLPRYPNALTLGAVPDQSLIYQVARSIGRQCRRLGVHINFAPVADINVNPQNPVIGFRAFGADRHRVTQLSLLFFHGLQDEQIVAVAKHFPGHGDTYLDSHFELPVLPHDTTRLDSIELYPFRHLIKAGIPGIMIGHLLVPSLDTFTATVSPRVIRDLLRAKLGFKGLVFSDALNMKAVALYFPPGELEVRALEAGADILLYVDNVPVVFRAIHEAVLKGRLREEEIDEKVWRILALKAYLGLSEQAPRVPVEGWREDLWAEPLLEPLRQSYIQAVTLLQNRQDLLPLGYLGSRRLVYVQLGYERPAPLYRYLAHYCAMDAIVIPNPEKALPESLLQVLQGYTTFIVGYFGLSNNPRRNFGIRPKALDLLCEIARSEKEIILCLFGSPYALSYFGRETAIILGYQEDTLAQWQTAGIIFGTSPPYGQLFLPLPLHYPRMVRYNFERYRPIYPYRSPYSFQRTDSLLRHFVAQKLSPGFAVAVIYRDTFVYTRGVGSLSYEESRTPSPTHTLYDLASLTKVFATTLMAMDLYEKGVLRLYEPLGVRCPEWQAYPLSHLTPYQLLTHTAGYPPTLPLLPEVLAKKPFASTFSLAFPFAVSRKQYLQREYPEHVWEKILQQAPSPTKKVIYSDIGFVVLGRYLEKLAGERLETYVTQRFYQPMGLYGLVFHPTWYSKDSLCAPSEVDTVWRKDTLRGYVHDPMAALLGGSGGHAGLFGTAADVAKLLWLFYREGEYGGHCYLSPATVRTFTSAAENLERGLGWDKPGSQRSSFLPRMFSQETFGHLGFTGTAAWCDPKRHLIVVILSNRTYPSSNDPRFNQQKVRLQLLEAIEADLGLR
ncbi:MAG: serine hydrolase [Bacteroidia bacterium]|nr:serine hydrolase [Bacteroidia bacterium]MDW8088326.1 glycoside hydrolase family 3 N-terminal domain-containing protein [Bacteroidia bacterium]